MFWLSLAVSAQERSVLVTENTQIQKQHGLGQSIFTHENHFINPFSEYQIIVEKDEETILWYRVGGQKFDENHSLFISEDASDSEKTISAWSEVQTWIYKKIILHEATYEVIDGIFTPRQSVAAGSYYRVIYNHDSTPPQCEAMVFSQDSAGIKKVDIPENSWLYEEKYASFVCSDSESWCFCDESNPGCFIQERRVLTVAQAVWHNEVIYWNISNSAWLSSVCDSSQQVKILYDTLAPDMGISIDDIDVDTTNTREYVVNDNVLYDGQQVEEKRFYNLENTISLKASSSTKMHFELTDMYDALRTDEGVSWIKSYELIVSKQDENTWLEIWNISSMFDEYNHEWLLTQDDSQIIIWEDIPFLKQTFTKKWSYQIYLSFKDSAWNQARVIMYFDVVPNSIDGNKSYIKTQSRNTVYADDINFYEYELFLKDQYGNSIVWKEVFNLEHNCNGLIWCTDLRQDMVATIPSGTLGIDIFDEVLLSDEQWRISFKIKSFVPGLLHESFSFEMFDWDEKFVNTGSIRLSQIFGQENNFLYLFSWDLSVYQNNLWGNEIPVSEEALFRLHIGENTPRSFDGQVEDFSSFIQTNYVSESSISLSSPLDFNIDWNVYFSGSIDTTFGVNEYNKIWVEIVESLKSPIEVSYVLSWREIKHYLTSWDTGTSPIVVMKKVDVLSNPVKIIWNLQWVWNSQSSFERQNISELSSSSMRNAIRKNISISIRWRQHDTTVWGVKYIDASTLSNNIYTIESTPGFETLVVKNGNIHINSDFINPWNMIGIISYIDSWYQTDDGYNDIGNVYVDRDISQFQAAIYADGALISTSSESPIEWSSSFRMWLLEKQLYIKWSLFTRNTIWGATLNNGEYILPGWETTGDEELATQYDLHHIRRWADECIEHSWSCLYNEYFILEYDPRINSDPPVLFSI
jgi:hypothetical protein